MPNHYSMGTDPVITIAIALRDLAYAEYMLGQEPTNRHWKLQRELHTRRLDKCIMSHAKGRRSARPFLAELVKSLQWCANGAGPMRDIVDRIARGQYTPAA